MYTKFGKRFFDFIVAFIAIIFLFPLLLFIWIIVSVDTSSNGIFFQERIGQFGQKFIIYKFKSIHPKNRNISKLGAFIRRYKIDEYPQFFNVLKGDMSIVGPRPDVPGYYDNLKGEARKILKLKPGLTSEASIKYANEENILNKQEDSLVYNDTVIFPDKVKINLEYYYKQSILLDLQIIYRTVLKIK